MSNRPVIGITSYVEQARWGVWDVKAALIPYSYVDTVRSVGAIAVVLPPDGAATAALVHRLDGLVLAGGADIDPERYGAPAHERSVTRPDRDAGELSLLREALACGLPVLGVCRGAQVLAVAYGGTLHQHLPDVLGHERHQPAPGVFGSHGVRFAAGSLAERIFGSAAEINSYHHQGIAHPGRLTVTGWADDGLPEAVEDPDRPFVLGVEWHPEEARDERPFAALAEASSQHAGDRA